MIGIETENGFQQCDGTSVPDAELSLTSTNSVQNKVIVSALNKKANISTNTNDKVYGSHAITFAWTNDSYFQVMVDGTVVCQIKGFTKID